MDKNIFKSKGVIITLGIVLGLIILFLVFRAGMFYGIKKSKFNLEWGRNYGRFFGEPRMNFFRESHPKERMGNAFGNAGTILSVSSNSIVMQANDGNEKVINVDANTLIHFQRTNISIKDLKVGDKIIVIGEPKEDGTIQARLIRVFRLLSSTSSLSR